MELEISPFGHPQQRGDLELWALLGVVLHITSCFLPRKFSVPLKRASVFKVAVHLVNIQHPRNVCFINN